MDISRAETFGGFFAEGMVINRAHKIRFKIVEFLSLQVIIAEGSMGLDGEVFIVDV